MRRPGTNLLIKSKRWRLPDSVATGAPHNWQIGSDVAIEEICGQHLKVWHASCCNAGCTAHRIYPCYPWDLLKFHIQLPEVEPCQGSPVRKERFHDTTHQVHSLAALKTT